MAVLINALAIVFGGLVGMVFRRIIKKDICEAVLKVIGICVIIFGIMGIIKSMLIIDVDTSTGQYIFKSSNELLLIILLASGTLFGELLHLNKGIERLGNYIEKKFNSEGFSQGFINATLIFCVGAMGITGSVLAAVGDNNMLYLKSMIDGITAIILAATIGYGVIFAAITVLLYQGLIFILANVLGDFMSNEFINAFSMLGYAMVLCIGINFLSKDKIKIANMLPSILFVILYFLIFK